MDIPAVPGLGVPDASASRAAAPMGSSCSNYTTVATVVRTSFAITQ
jgi:hypothetical protein